MRFKPGLAEKITRQTGDASRPERRIGDDQDHRATAAERLRLRHHVGEPPRAETDFWHYAEDEAFHVMPGPVISRSSLRRIASP